MVGQKEALYLLHWQLLVFEATEVVANPRARFAVGFFFFLVGAIVRCHG